jgi:hypothetical protein
MKLGSYFLNKLLNTLQNSEFDAQVARKTFALLAEDHHTT